jgi:tRNA A-37 threonylcarbamoyl transferase component Bud32
MTKAVRIIGDSPLLVHLMAQLASSSLDTAEWLQQNTTALKSDGNNLVSSLVLGDRHCCVKLYAHNTQVKKLLRRLRIGRPLQSYKAARSLRKKGMPVPEPFGCLLVPEGVLLLAELIACEGNLEDVFLSHQAEETAHQMLQAAGTSIAQLHRAGYAHGDCKWANLLWDGRGIHFVDLDSVSRASLNSGKQSRDLARFTLSAEELEIGAPLYDLFLESYLQGADESRRELVERMAPFLYTLRARHLSRYGPRGQRLV